MFDKYKSYCDRYYDKWLYPEKEIRITLLEWQTMMIPEINIVIGSFIPNDYFKKSGKQNQMLIMKREDISVTVQTNSGLINFEMMERLDPKLNLIMSVEWREWKNDNKL